MILTTFLFASLAAELKPIGEIRIVDGTIRLGDVARIDAGGEPQIGAIVIARLPKGVREVQLSRAKVQKLAERAVPGLQLRGSAEGVITVRYIAPTIGSAARCYEASSAIASGGILTADHVTVVQCEAERTASSLQYDRATAATVASSAIRAGDYLGNVRLGQSAPARRGDKLTLRSQAGPVVIERSVVAMQGARATDQRLFVRTDDGAVFATDFYVERAR